MKKTILIVDDNPHMSSLLCEMLDVYDYDSVRASNGNEALSALDDGKIHMVITDLRMPNMNGLELLQKIKDRNPKMPVVLISGYSIEEATDSDTAQPDGFLAKPFMMADVERLLNALL